MPFSSIEIIIGKSIPVILVGLFDFTLMLGVVHFAFHVPIRGSVLLLFSLAFIYTLVELGKGMAISVFLQEPASGVLTGFHGWYD